MALYELFDSDADKVIQTSSSVKDLKDRANLSFGIKYRDWSFDSNAREWLCFEQIIIRKKR